MRFVRVDETTLHVLMEHRAQIEEGKGLYGSDYHDNDLVFPSPRGDYYMPSQVTGRISENSCNRLASMLPFTHWGISLRR